MAKPTSIKDAIKRWEEKNEKCASTSKEIGLQFQWPPIEKMDSNLSQLLTIIYIYNEDIVEIDQIVKIGDVCRDEIELHINMKPFLLFASILRKLSLSTNMIEKIGGLSGLRNLKILSLSRNYIKSFSGLEAVGDSLEQLWISYNFIDKTKGIGALRNLKVLYMSNNLIKEWSEFQKLQECQELKELSFMGNPLCESYEESGWRLEATRKLPQLEKLDGEPVINEINGPSTT